MTNKTTNESYKRLSPEEWENAWQKHWKNAQMNYELPEKTGASTTDEREFLTQVRSADVERERLARINQEFEMGFKPEMYLRKPDLPFLPVVAGA